ncbi:MAG: hypothetical protein HZB43_13495, partial [candidate division Zixibacteria bacterium]|nr:hypothetical protein [candidate division Zixibacteria bacterium]
LYFLVPAYNKIRVSYDAILFRIADFDQQVHQMGSIGAFPATLPIEWDISLVELSSITRRWHQRKLPIINTKRQRELQKPRPRFIWRALARIQGRLAFDLLFDATSFERNDLLHSVVVYDEQLANFVSQIWQIPAFQVMVGSTPAKSIWENLASW